MLYTFNNQKLVDDQIMLDTIEDKMRIRLMYHTGMVIEYITSRFDEAADMLRDITHQMQHDINTALAIVSDVESYDEQLHEQLDELAGLQASIEHPFYEVSKDIRYEYLPDRIRVYNGTDCQDATSFKDASKIAIEYLHQAREQAMDALSKAKSAKEKLELRVAIDKASSILRWL